ncbi:hypothetical protein A6X21_12110 [Planctopirus hydrillae]|uniref:RDD domain-containing protein n=2 Tax=Planctopirus hydrillae TaxID=1841610 RepID=A0A1C3E5D5_9PLAN|nr:hypothetical protein A6X21_12110 [Planctopirus hydrillae]
MSAIEKSSNLHIVIEYEGGVWHRRLPEGVSLILTRGIDQRSPEEKRNDPLSSQIPWNEVRSCEKTVDLLEFSIQGDECRLFVHDRHNARVLLYRNRNDKWSTSPVTFTYSELRFRGDNSIGVATEQDGKVSTIITRDSWGDLWLTHVVDGVKSDAVKIERLSNQPLVAMLFAMPAKALVTVIAMLVFYAWGVNFLVSRGCHTTLRLANTTVTLASIHSRVAAGVVDFVIICLPLFILSIYCFVTADIHTALDRLQENSHVWILNQFLWMFFYSGVYLSSAIMLLIVVEGKYGWTPGKHLFGLVTLSTTLRPCGFILSLVRTAALPIDALGFGAVCILTMASNEKCQRVGDLISGVVVVRRCFGRK